MTLPFDPEVVVLDKRHDRGAFSCGKAPLDQYLQKQASQDMKRKLAAVFVLQVKDTINIVGFFALSNLSIEPGDWEPAITKKLPKHRPIPCTLLSQFAVAIEWQGKGAANWLLGDVLQRVWGHSQEQGSFALIVDAVDDDAIAYWLKQGFLPFPSTPERLFLPMATIGKLFT